MQAKMRVDVVVDTWNLRRQAKDVLGFARFPNMGGIKAHLHRLGFEVNHIYAAVACDAYSGRVSSKVAKALQTSKPYVEAIDRCTYATVLHGRLTDRSGELEEKLVDVLCAVQICRSAMEIVTKTSTADAILVLSEDIDLTPAYDMARSLGVPVFAIANETVYTRPGDWIVLGDGAMADICGKPQGVHGHELKRTVAKQLTTAATSRRYSVNYVHSRSGETYLRHRTGAQAVASPQVVAASPGSSTLDLYPAEAHVVRGEFPSVRGAIEEPAGDLAAHVTIGEVLEWRQPTRVRVTCSDGRTKTLEAAPGSVLPGMKVGIYHPPDAGPVLLGAIDKLPLLENWDDPTSPRIATVEKSAPTPGAVVAAKVPRITSSVALLPPSESQPRIGDKFIVVPRDYAGKTVTKVIALSTALPWR